MSNVITLPAYGWAPRKDQKEVWEALMSPDIDTVVVCAHRRWGKDELALHSSVIHSMQRVGSRLYALPQYSQARRSIYAGINARTGRTRINDCVPEAIVKKRDEKGMLLEFVNNSTLQLVGSDQPDSLVGAGIVGYTASEAALSNPAAFSLIRPMLLETQGRSTHISSPRGKNHFYKLYQAHKSNPKSYVTTLSAEDTGVFTSAQLKAERHAYVQEHGVAMGESLFFQEYYASWDAATVGGVFTQELALLNKEGRYGPCAYDPRYPVDTSVDLGISDQTVYLFWQNVGAETRLIDVYASNDNGLEHYVKMLADKKYVYGTHYAPHDAQHRELISGTSRTSQAARMGLIWQIVPALAKTDQIALGCQLMNRLVINNTPDLDTGEPVCEYAMECLGQYQFAYDEIRKISSNKPVHDWSSHLCDAFMLYAVAKAKDTGFARPSGNQMLSADVQYPRLSAIMAQRNKPTASMWG